MKTLISLLRGINVNGQKKIRMAELQAMVESLGFANVQTYLQTGNVLFESHEPDATAVATLLEAHIQQIFGYEVAVLLRDKADFERIMTQNPFLNGRQPAPTQLHVTFLAQTPDEAALSRLGSSPNADNDEFFIDQREVFLYCPNGYGRSKLTNTFFEKKLGLAATTRNWNTVTALYNMLNPA